VGVDRGDGWYNEFGVLFGMMYEVCSPSLSLLVQMFDVLIVSGLLLWVGSYVFDSIAIVCVTLSLQR